MKPERRTRLLVALAILVAAAVLLRGYVTDDTFIHLRYAQNLLEEGRFAFNPDESSYGATSPLWIFGLVLLLKLGVAPLTAPWLLGLLSAVLALLVLDAILERLPLRPDWRGAILILTAADAWFLRWSLSGMETPLATALLLLLLWPLVADQRPGGLPPAEADVSTAAAPLWPRYLAWGVAAGLAGLVRPEFLLLAAATLPCLLFVDYFRAADQGGTAGRVWARPHRPILAALAGWLVVVGPWLAYAVLTFGRLTPETAAAKSNPVTLAPVVLGGYLARSVLQLAAVQGPLWIALIVLLVMIPLARRRRESREGSDWSGTARAPAAADAKAARAYDSGRWTVWLGLGLVGIVTIWSVLLIGGYAIKQVWIISRYLSPLAPPLLLAGGVVAIWLARGVGPRRFERRIVDLTLIGAVVATLLLNGWLLLARVRPHAQQFPRGIKECYLDYGEWLRDNTPPETVVAALDIGAVGYASQRHVLDLMGLVSPEILAIGRREGFEAMVESGAWLSATTPDGRPPTYLVDRNLGPPRWAGRTVRGVNFALIDTCSIAGVGLREPQVWTVALYRLSRISQD